MDGRGVVGIVRTAMDVDAVNSVLMDTLRSFIMSVMLLYSITDASRRRGTNVRGAKNSSVPVTHHHVFTICKTIGA